MFVFSIRIKLLVFFCLLTVTPVAVLGILVSIQTENILEQRVSREMRLEVVTAAETVETYLNGVRRDLLSLSRFLQRWLTSDMGENNWRVSGEEFYKVIQAEGSYYQIRFIGTDGWEKLRINNFNGLLTPVPPGEYQFKGERYYFSEALRLKPGEVYLSPLDFNVEHGRIEEPRKLVTRMATPVTNQKGETLGIVIINIFGDELLKMLEAVPPVGGAQMFLVGENDYVERFRVEEGIDVQVGASETLSERLGVPLAERRQDRKAMVTKGESALLATAPITVSAAGGSTWLLVKTFPRDLLEEDLHRIQKTISILALVLLLPAAALAVMAARSFSRPIDKVIGFADSIAEGDYEQQLHHPRKDEFGHLTETLNRMAAALASSRKRLTDWNQTLQREVDRRTQELQSAVAELESSKDELQFLNEELTMINAELQSNMDELEQSNDDLRKLMDSSAMATLFLDRKLNIVRFTPPASEIFNLLPSDIGSSIRRFAGNLDYPGLEQDVRSVLKGEKVESRKIADFSGSTHYLMRLLPDRNADDEIEGVVLTFTDITPLIRSEM
jgi:HAMP domain-containing protein